VMPPPQAAIRAWPSFKKLLLQRQLEFHHSIWSALPLLQLSHSVWHQSLLFMDDSRLQRDLCIQSSGMFVKSGVGLWRCYQNRTSFDSSTMWKDYRCSETGAAVPCF